MEDNVIDAIYIHIPFCLKKCNYCDFLSFQSEPAERERYVEAIIEEIKLYPKFKYKTVYFGGGTPSLLTPKQISKILSRLAIEKDAEITLELNPKTVNLEKLKEFKAVGINRLSIGIQSFNDNMLKTLGRLHNSLEGEKTFKEAREVGFENISLDLMFSIPNQTLEDLKSDLNKLFHLKPEHISIYSLIWEEGTDFFEKLKLGIYQETENELEASMYELIIDETKKNGYIHYEISNFCLEGKKAIHNTKYWENKEYLGIGLGASGYFKGKRYKNTLKFLEYYDKIRKKISPIQEVEIIDEEEKEIYDYILGLRLIQRGIIPKGKYVNLCNELVSEGFLKKNNSVYILSKKGILLANDVFSKFV